MLRCNRFNWLGQLRVLEIDQQVYFVYQTKDEFIGIIYTDIMTFVKVWANNGSGPPTMCLCFAPTVNLKKKNKPPRTKTNKQIPTASKQSKKIKPSNFSGFSKVKFLRQNICKRSKSKHLVLELLSSTLCYFIKSLSRWVCLGKCVPAACAPASN